MLDDARRVVQRQLGAYSEGERPHLPGQTLLLADGMRHIARAYAQASRERRRYLLIAPVSALFLAVNECRQLAPLLQVGLADYLALTALYHSEPRYWPASWEAQTSGQPAQMVAHLAALVPSLRTVAGECFLRSGPARMRDAINAHLRSEKGFEAVHGSFGLRAGLRPARLAGLLNGSIAVDDRKTSGLR